MAELVPYPFDALVTRMHRERERNQAIFDLPERKFVWGEADLDFSVRFHDRTVSSPLGPAAGPQTQMAQNIVLSWLGGCRVMELKTVQINDELDIPRPCIDMQTIGFNAEWSQELKLGESLDEYVKGAMLVEILRSRCESELAPGFDRVHYDMSVGYDLKGIRHERVREFIVGMMDATATVERFRKQIPSKFKELRDLEFPTRLSDTVTLSTFHGCPPDEIEGIIEHLMREHHLHCIVKFNPMLLGPGTTRSLLHDALGYTELSVPDSAFERDTKWDEAVAMMERLSLTADELGLGLGAKFSNTLIVQNERGFLPETEKEVYLSGQPLHVLAMNLVGRFREHFGDRFPISFAAGIDRGNFADAVALGLVPVTVCSDLLKPQGYGRLQTYYRELSRRMKSVATSTIDDFVIRAFGKADAALERLAAEDPVQVRCREALSRGADLKNAAGEDLHARWVSAARLLNTEHYVSGVTADPRYSRDKNRKIPKKIGSRLELFDCVSCDKCIPVCPNDANFVFTPPRQEIPVVKLRREGEAWSWLEEGATKLTEGHQIGNFADFCNECGNCDIFCPEDGGPYIVKPRFFGSEEQWRRFPEHDGFFMERNGNRDRVLARFGSEEYHLAIQGERVSFSGRGFEVEFQRNDPAGSLIATGPAEIDLTYLHIMDCVREGLFAPGQVNYINVLAGDS